MVNGSGSSKQVNRPNRVKSLNTCLTGNGLVYVSFLVADIDGIAQTVKENGVKLQSGDTKLEVRPGYSWSMRWIRRELHRVFLRFLDVSSYRRISSNTVYSLEIPLRLYRQSEVPSSTQLDGMRGRLTTPGITRTLGRLDCGRNWACVGLTEERRT